MLITFVQTLQEASEINKIVYRRTIASKEKSSEIWGQVVKEEPTCYRLCSGRIAKKSTQGEKWDFIDTKIDKRLLYQFISKDNPDSWLFPKMRVAPKQKEVWGQHLHFYIKQAGQI